MFSPVFITARFRTGSTLLWNIFRQIPEVNAYYEPLHEKLPGMIRRRTPPQATHFNVDTYFREYPPFKELVEHHTAEFGVCRLYLEANDKYPLLRAWIQYLLLHATAQEKTPVFQFNRVDFRLPWLKATFPESKSIHLYRSPRDQWISSITDYPELIEGNKDADPYLITTWARDLRFQFPFLASSFIRHVYQRHYYLWKLSYLAGSRQADLSISYEDVLANPRTAISQMLEVANLNIRNNLERGLAVVVQRSTNKWVGYHAEEWFDDLEQECEAVLDELGLNQQFGLKPLAEIIDTSPRYQELLADSRVHTWAQRNSQLTIVALEETSDDKEQVISELKTVSEQRLAVIKALEETEAERLATISALETVAERQQSVIEALESAATARQTAINALQSRADMLEAAAAERLTTIDSLQARIATFEAAADERLIEINRLTDLLTYGHQELTEQYEEQVRELQGIADEREALIHVLARYQRTSVRHWIESFDRRLRHRRTVIKGKIRRTLKVIKRKSGYQRLRSSLKSIQSPKLGSFFQYPPQPINIPAKYHKPSSIAQDRLPCISIVTPSYNQAAFVEQTIKSVLDQEYPNLDYIIQDGASTDGTVEILERYRPQLAHLESARDEGQTNAINLGFAKSDGEIMAYLNSDDLILPGTLPYVAEFFVTHPDIDVVYGHRIIIDEYDREVGRWVMPPHDDEVLDWADYIPQETMFWRRRIWEKIGGHFDEDFHFAMDWDLVLRFRAAGAKIVRLPRFMGAFRVHSQQKTTAQISDVGQKEMFHLRERCLGHAVTQQEVSRAVQPYIRKHILYHALYRFGIVRY